MFCHPGLPDAFGHIFIGSFPGAALEHGVVGDTGFQTGAGGAGEDSFAFLQLRGKKTFGWNPKHAEQMKGYLETLVDMVLKWVFTDPGRERGQTLSSFVNPCRCMCRCGPRSPI